MGLADEINDPSDKLEDYTIFLSGAKKVGKTSLAAQFPRSFIFEFEVGNAKHLKCAHRDITSLDELDKVLGLAEKESRTGVKNTWIFDEIGILYDMILEDVCQSNGVNDPGEIGFGKGWFNIKRKFRAYLLRFQALNGGKIYTGHEEEKTSSTRTNRSVTKSEARLSKEGNRVMEEITHMWLVMNFDSKGNRYLQIKGDDYIKAGHGFEDRFALIEDGKIPLGKNVHEAYQNFLKAWNNQPIVEATATPTSAKVKVTTPTFKFAKQ